MRIAVKDANILIDLVEAALLDSWFALKIETLTTDIVMGEIDDEQQVRVLQPYVNAGLLKVVVSGPEEMTETASLRLRAPSGVTFEDCSALHLAVSRKASLMTGDALLRKFAIKSGVQVCGTLWILDMLVEEGILTPQIAGEKLRMLRNRDRRLPSVECEQRLHQWGVVSEENKK